MTLLLRRVSAGMVLPQLKLCPVCSVVDDVFHFLFDNHKKLIGSYYCKRPSMYKCVEMFCTRNNQVVRDLAKYVYLSFNATGNLKQPPWCICFFVYVPIEVLLCCTLVGACDPKGMNKILLYITRRSSGGRMTSSSVRDLGKLPW